MFQADTSLLGKADDSFLPAEQATSNVEYAVILSLIGSIVVTGTVLLGNGMNLAFQGAGAGGATSASAASSTPASKTIFADSFTSAKASAGKWDFNGSWWNVSNGTLQAGPVAGWNSMIAYAENSTITNGTISFNATLTQGWGFGVFFDLSGDPVTGPMNGYCFQYDTGYGSGAFVLRKWVNGVEINPSLGLYWPPANYQWTGVERLFTVQTQGSLITASVDGMAVISVNDSTYTSGGVGLRLWNDPGATFQNFKVTSP